MPDVLLGTAPYKIDSCNFLKTQNAFFDNCESVEVSIFLRKKNVYFDVTKDEHKSSHKKVEILA